MTSQSPEARRAAKGSLGLVLMQLVNRGSGAAFALGAARIVEPDQYGRYASVLAMFLMFAAFADLGIGAAVGRLASREEASAPELKGAIVSVSALVGLFVGCLAVGTGFLLLDVELRSEIAIAAAGLPLQAAFSCLSGLLDGTDQVAKRAAIGCVSPLVQFGGGLAVLAMTGSVAAAIIALAVGPGIGSMVALWVLRDVRQSDSALASVRSGVVRRVVTTAAPFAALAGVTAVNARFDVVILAAWRSPEETAMYDVAARVVEATGLVVAGVAPPSLVLLNRRRAAGDEEGARRVSEVTGRMLQLAGLGLTVLFVGSAASVTSVFGAAFDGAEVPLRILGAKVWLTFQSGLIGTILLSTGRVGRAVPVAASVVIFTVAVTSILVPLAGVNGAAVAGVLSSAVAFALYSAVGRRWGEPMPPLPRPRLIGAAAIAAAAAAYVEHGSAPWLSPIVGIGLYSCGVLGLRAARSEDLRWLRRVS